MNTNLTPKPGHIVAVSSIPDCNFCEAEEAGVYDFRTRYGPWGNGCEECWIKHRAEPGTGVGIAQRWIVQ